jgi:hypothetical protein
LNQLRRHQLDVRADLSSSSRLVAESKIRAGKNGVNTWRIQTSCQRKRRFRERTLRVGQLPVRVGVGHDEAHIGTFGCEGDRPFEICCSFGAGRTFKQTTRSAKQIPINVIWAQREQVIEQVDRCRIIEEPPVREAGTGQSGNIIRRSCKPGYVASFDSSFGIRMGWQHEGGHGGVVAHGIRVATEEQFGLDAPTVALHLCWLVFDYAREFADGLCVPAFIDVNLSLLRTAVPRGGDRPEDRREQQR